jgi:hypothetical protein
MGNIVNVGNVEKQDDKIYYNTVSNDWMYSMSTDDSDIKKLNDDTSSFINVVGGRVYYCNDSDDRIIYCLRPDAATERSWDEVSYQ